MEFKIGDKVLVKYGKSSSSRELAGKICTIEKAYPLFCVLEEEEGNDIYEKGGVWNEDIELYEEEFPEKWYLNFENAKKCLEFINSKNTYDYEPYLNSHYVHFEGLKFINGYNTPEKDYIEITLEQFKKHILKESTTMKNLLETEFVIENCTLSQRLAIKAYCDEKKIKYWSENTFINEQAPCIHWDLEEFLCGITSGNKKIITFSELIQFLDQYQPEPEFKVGDFVYFEGKHHQAGPYLLKEKISDGAFKDSNNETRDIKKSNGAYRHATPEEIKKWKEENEIKLPRINQYDGKVDRDFIIYGNNCAKLKISWFKNIGDLDFFLNIGENRTIRSIKLNSDVEITIAHIEQIKKFIEHNNL